MSVHSKVVDELEALKAKVLAEPSPVLAAEIALRGTTAILKEVSDNIPVRLRKAFIAVEHVASDLAQAVVTTPNPPPP